MATSSYLLDKAVATIQKEAVCCIGDVINGLM